MPANVPTVDDFNQLANRLVAMQAAVDGLNEFATNTAKYLADVELRLAALEPEPAAVTLVGSSSGTSPWVDLTTRVGHDLAVRRSYQSPGQFVDGLTFARSAAAIDVGKRASVYSFKGGTGNGFTDWPGMATGSYDDRFRTFLESVPSDHDAVVVFHHERDGGHGSSGDGNPADAVAVDRRFYPIVAEVNKSRAKPVRYGVILMGYTVTNRDASVWFDPDFCDVLGFDVYSPSGAPFADKAAPLVDYAAAHGLPALVAETGTPPSAARAQWITDAIAYARDVELAAWCYWNAGSSTLSTDAEYQALGG